MREELRKLWHLPDIHDISTRHRYIQSAANVWADRLSRELDDADWQLNPRIFAYMHRLIRAEVDGLVNPCCSRIASPVYHNASRIATRAWLNDYFDPKHGITEKIPIPIPSSDREEWHLPAWGNKAKVYRTCMD
eukprot:jgi/Tetstr1/457849/TSEL_004251.t1